VKHGVRLARVSGRWSEHRSQMSHRVSRLEHAPSADAGNSNERVQGDQEATEVWMATNSFDVEAFRDAPWRTWRYR
jgi:hypothetical protein